MDSGEIQQQASEDKSNDYSGTEGIYLLPHHVKEIERLQWQHRLILSATGGVLITAPLQKPSIRVLDCGAADGTWLLEVSKRYPQHEWSLHGTDIGSALFPPKVGLYSCLDLHEHDIREPLPVSLSWQESFDLLHQRFLIWGLRGSEWPKVMEGHYKLLRPGGWIQLVEAQWIDRDNAFDPVKFPNLAKQTKMQQWSTGNFGMDAFIAYKLEDLLREAGFQNVSKTQFELGYGAKAREDSWKGPSADMLVETFRNLGSKLPPGGIPGVARDVEEFYGFLDQLKIEIQQHGYATKLNYVIAQKPF